MISKGRISLSKGQRATAYHEAGHAAAAYILGMPIGRVTIVPKDDFLGSCEVKIPKWLRPDVISDVRTEAWIQRRIVMLFAGQQAEKSHTGRNNHVGADSDKRNALALAEYICHSDKELSAYLKWLEIKASLLMQTPRALAGVEAVAQALMVQRTLRSDEVKAIIRQSIQSAACPDEVGFDNLTSGNTSRS